MWGTGMETLCLRRMTKVCSYSSGSMNWSHGGKLGMDERAWGGHSILIDTLDFCKVHRKITNIHSGYQQRWLAYIIVILIFSPHFCFY